MRRVVLAGGSGFLGQILAEHLATCGWSPVILTRSPHSSARFREISWDGQTVADWKTELDGAEAVVNLAGRSVNTRATPEHNREIMNSRVNATRAVGQAISRCQVPPAVWLNASTATIYSHTMGAPHNEESRDFTATPEVKDAFSVEVAEEWEHELEAAHTPRTRKAALRITLVFGIVPGGVFQILRRLSKLGLGGRMGSGKQFVSWIHERDFCRAVEWVLTHGELSGPINMAAPHPLTNAEMMRVMRRICGIPVGLPAARWMLEIGAWVMRTETELLLKSRNVVPGRLIKSGFQFEHPTFESAVTELEQRMRKN